MVVDIWKSAREKYQMVGKFVIDIWRSAREKYQIWEHIGNRYMEVCQGEVSNGG